MLCHTTPYGRTNLNTPARELIALGSVFEVIMDRTWPAPGTPRLCTDGGEDEEADEEEEVDRANVEVMDAGEAEPAEPRWKREDFDDLDPEDIPEVSGPKTRATEGAEGTPAAEREPPDESPTSGRPNTARAPGASRVQETDAYVVALEMCARLPEEVRLPEQAADTIPAAFEAELEQDIQTFAAQEFDNEAPYVDTLSFDETDEGDIWVRIRIGAPPEAFADLTEELDAIEAYALQRLDSLF